MIARFRQSWYSQSSCGFEKKNDKQGNGKQIPNFERF